MLAQIDKYYEKAEFPFELLPKLKELGIMGGTIKGYGCPVPQPSLHVVRACGQDTAVWHARAHAHTHRACRS